MGLFLCGQTGSINRGCEAIIRSTVKVLDLPAGDIFLATHAPEQDRAMAREIGINMISYAKYHTQIQRYFCGAIRRLVPTSLCGQNWIQAPLFSRLDQNDLCLNVGGDTYCYGRPVISLALNRFTHKKGINNILWCCSVEKAVLRGEILADIQKYKYIFAREQITYNNLIEAGVDHEKVIKCCDPAFFLNTKPVQLPRGFAPGNTVGINVSPLVIRQDHSVVYEAVISLIKYILQNTDMHICLIPHVYSIMPERQDYPILKRIWLDIADERVSLIDKEYDCEQIKFIISQCRYFVGARTHSTIAAYSTRVPTIALGYSVKSRGIALDLFGTTDHYVLPYQDIQTPNDIVVAFQHVQQHEQEIHTRYEKLLPGYMQQLPESIEKYLVPLIPKTIPKTVCNPELCTGCMACVHRCPNHCIHWVKDREGFSYPEIDYRNCINCGFCRKICPVLNRPKDDHKKPVTKAVVNTDDAVRMSSSSGGIFSALAGWIINQGGAVCGVVSDEQGVHHQICKTHAELAAMRGSKYVQSEIGNVYIECREILNSGRKLLFTGTPCQIAGFKAYLGREYENLYLQDFICHGVPSQGVWQLYLDQQAELAGSNLESVSFRNKSNGWRNYSLVLRFKNGKIAAQPVTENIYLRGFVQSLFLRKSCRICAFKQIHRQSDITLADFWGVGEQVPQMSDDKGTSLVLLHSSKGADLYHAVRDEVKEKDADFDQAIRSNPSMLISVGSTKIRDHFFASLQKSKDYTKTYHRLYGPGILCKIKRGVIKYL